MLELFRKYSAIAVIVLIILFIGLVFMIDGVGDTSAGGGPKKMSLDGKAYSYKEVDKEGNDKFRAFRAMMGNGYVDEELVGPYATVIGKFNNRTFNFEVDEVSFMANRLTLQKLAKQYGVIASQEQIEKVIQEKLFVSDGKFDQKGYDKFIERDLKRFGTDVQDLNELVGEMIAIERLQKVVGVGVSQDDEVLSRFFKVSSQTVTYNELSMPLDNIKETISVSEEELKTYWEANKNDFLTEVKVKVQYAYVDAGLEELRKAYEEKAKNKARAEGKSEEEVNAMRVELPLEEKKGPLSNAVSPLDGLMERTQESGSASTFEAHAADLNVKLITTDFISLSTAPDIFQGEPMRNALSLIADQSKLASLSDFHTVGGNQSGKYLVFRLLEREEAKPLPYEVAKEDAEAALIQKKLSDSLDDQTDALRVQLVEAASEGKLAEKAKELGMKFTTEGNVTQRSITPDKIEGFLAARATKLNEVSKPVVDRYNNSIVFAYPTKRSFVKSIEREIEELQFKNSTQLGLNNYIFNAWFDTQVEELDFQRFETPAQ